MAEIGVMKKLTIGGSTYTIPEYSLPIASASTLGGVKIGTGLTINSTTGVLSATGLDFDEADPVFTASAAYGITSTDITNWNSKTSNTGTITKVQTSAGAHTIVNVSSGNVSFNVPTKTSHLTNDSGFLTSSDLASVLKYKGTKASVANLPTTNNATGDVWHITADGSEYAWDGTIWQELGTSIDLSGYALKSELPTDTDTWRPIQVNDSDILGSGIDTGKLNLKAGNAITLSASSGTVTFNHSDTSSQSSSSNSGRTYIQSITLDTYGHVTGISTATETVTDSDEKVKVSHYSTSSTVYPIFYTGNNTPATTTQNVNVTDFTYVFGTNDRTLKIGSTSKTGKLQLGQLAGYTATITPTTLTAGQTYTLPNKTGTVALTSDIPAVPTKTSQLTNDGNGTSAFATMDDIGSFGGGTVTSITLKAGSGITLDTDNTAITTTGTRTISHSDTSSQASVSNSGRTYIQSITLDSFGHVTALSSATETVTNTDTKLQVAAVTSGTTYYPIVGTGTTAATRQYDTTGFIYKGTNGTTSAVGSAQLTLGNSTASGTANNKQGQLIMYGSNAKKATITLAAPSADISLALPTSDGTLALTSQIPTVPTSTGSSETGVTATTTATKTTLGTASSIYGVKSGTNSTTTASKASGSNGSASTWVFEDVACDDITAWSAGSGSASFSATVSSHVLSFSHSHTHTAPSLTYSAKTASHVKSGGNGTAPSWSFTDVTVPIRADSATSVPNVSVASATVSITDPGHTHTI